MGFTSRQVSHSRNRVQVLCAFLVMFGLYYTPAKKERPSFLLFAELSPFAAFAAAFEFRLLVFFGAPAGVLHNKEREHHCLCVVIPARRRNRHAAKSRLSSPSAYHIYKLQARPNGRACSLAGKKDLNRFAALMRCPKIAAGDGAPLRFSTAAPAPPRCFRPRRRSAALPGTRFWSKTGNIYRIYVSA